MTRAHQLESWMFTAKLCLNNPEYNISPETVRLGLSHALGSSNAAVSAHAAELLADNLYGAE